MRREKKREWAQDYGRGGAKEFLQIEHSMYTIKVSFQIHREKGLRKGKKLEVNVWRKLDCKKMSQPCAAQVVPKSFFISFILSFTSVSPIPLSPFQSVLFPLLNFFQPNHPSHEFSCHRRHHHDHHLFYQLFFDAFPCLFTESFF